LPLGKDDYSPQKADNQSNVLDILHKAGVKVFWLDNNSTCKGACARVENISNTLDWLSAFCGE
jgi:lipid A ethanolaminephosphotransferase